MLNIVSILLGIVGGLVMLVGLLPFVWIANFVMFPIAGVGLLLGLISRGTAGRNLNLIVLVIGLLRVMIGSTIII